MYQAPRGTTDVLPADQAYFRHVEDKARAVARQFGYRRIDTPVFEEAGLFLRGVGEGTDILEKETYTFEDRGGDLLTLRPEGTAPVCRAYLQHGMHNLPQPVRLYYICPIFRYERPQSGRYRQHHQFGVEALGDADPSVDAEVIELGWRLLRDFGLKDLTLYLNTIGDARCRPGYLDKLTSYYQGHREIICEECKVRLASNPLRLLDCKQEGCKAIAAAAPRTTDYLCVECQDHWDRLLGYLSLLNLPYQLDHHLVRGLDYYTRTVFEIQPPAEASQSTILGGGRYDGLVQELGGKPTPGIGFGMGIERVVVNLKRQEVAVPPERAVDVVIAYVGSSGKEEALQTASRLRQQGVSSVLAPPGKSLKGQMRHASSMGAAYTIIIGDEELRRGTVIVRDMDKGEQREVPKEQAASAVRD